MLIFHDFSLSFVAFNHSFIYTFLHSIICLCLLYFIHSFINQSFNYSISLSLCPFIYQCQSMYMYVSIHLIIFIIHQFSVCHSLYIYLLPDYLSFLFICLFYILLFEYKTLQRNLLFFIKTISAIFVLSGP